MNYFFSFLGHFCLSLLLLAEVAKDVYVVINIVFISQKRGKVDLNIIPRMCKKARFVFHNYV